MEVTLLQVIRQRWHQTKRNLQVVDLVLVHDSSKLRGKYKLAKVTAVKVSHDGLVRSCTMGDRQTRSLTKRKEHRSVWQSLERSVQRLTLLLPVEEQAEELEVSDGMINRAEEGGDCHDDSKASHQNKTDDVEASGSTIATTLNPSATVFHPQQKGEDNDSRTF